MEDLESFMDREHFNEEDIRRLYRQLRNVVIKLETRIDILSDAKAHLEKTLRRTMQREKRNRKNIKKQRKKIVQIHEDCRELEELYLEEAERNAELEKEVKKLRKQNQHALRQNQNLLEDYGKEKAENERLGESVQQLRTDMEAMSQMKNNLHREMRQEIVYANVDIHRENCFSYSGLSFRESQNQVTPIGTIFERKREENTNLKEELANAQHQKHLWQKLAKQSQELRSNDREKLRQCLAQILFFKDKLAGEGEEMDQLKCRKLGVFIREIIRKFNYKR